MWTWPGWASGPGQSPGAPWSCRWSVPAPPGRRWSSLCRTWSSPGHSTPRLTPRCWSNTSQIKYRPPSLPDMLSLYCQIEWETSGDTNLINLSPAARLTAPSLSEVLPDEMYKSDQNQSGTKFNLKITFNVLWVRFSGNMIKYKYLTVRKREIKSISYFLCV